MNLPFNERRRKKLKSTFQALRLVYATDRTAAFFDSVLLFADAFLVMYRISVFGLFLDQTVLYIQERERFVLSDYFRSQSFYFFLILFGLWVLINFLKSVKNYYRQRLKSRFNYEIFPQQIIKKISQINLGDVESPEFQNLLSSVNNYAASRIFDTYSRARQVIHELIKASSAAFFVYQIHPFLPLGAALLVLPEIIYKYSVMKRKRGFLDASIERNKYINQVYRQAKRLENFAELKVNGVFGFLVESRQRAAEDMSEGVSGREYDRYVKGFGFGLLDQILFRILLLGLIAVAVVRKLTVGTFQSLFRYMLNLYSASLRLFDRLSIIGDNAQYICDYYDFLGFQGFGDVSTGEKVLNPGPSAIEVRNLTFSYPGRETAAISNVNFTVNSGDKAVLVGPDGSGETTILRLLCGLYKIERGDILFDSISIRELRRGELKNKISALFENYVRYHMSIKKNIIVSDSEREFNKDLYDRVLQVTMLDSWMEEQGFEDEQILGRLIRGGVEISNAFWQRVALARTLYRNRPVFIMDDPLSSVDSATRRRIFANMLEFLERKTLVVALPSVEDIHYFERVFRVEDGKVEEVELNT